MKMITVLLACAGSALTLLPQLGTGNRQCPNTSVTGQARFCEPSSRQPVGVATPPASKPNEDYSRFAAKGQSFGSILRKVAKRWGLRVGGTLTPSQEAQLYLQMDQGLRQTSNTPEWDMAPNGLGNDVDSSPTLELLQRRMEMTRLRAQFVAMGTGDYLIGPEKQIAAAYTYCVQRFRHLTFVLMATTDGERCIVAIDDAHHADYSTALRNYFNHVTGQGSSAPAPSRVEPQETITTKED